MPPIEIRKNIVALLTVGEERIVDLSSFQQFVKFVESQDVILGAFGGVFHRRAGFHEKRPVARLGEE